MLFAYNLTQQAYVAAELSVADTFLTRLVGLMGKRSLPPNSGLWIKPCNSVHTFGMRFAIDLVFLSKTHQVVKILEQVPPFRIVWPVPQACSVIEVPARSLQHCRTRTGDHIELAAHSS